MMPSDGGQSRSHLCVEETAFSEAESKDRRGTRSREQKGWPGWQECQISGLYDTYVESRIGRRRGRVRVECLSAALRGGAKVRRLAKCQTIEPSNLCARIEARDGMMPDR